MEEKILEAKGEFNKVIDFVTRDALTWELHSVEGEVFRTLLRMGRILDLTDVVAGLRFGRAIAAGEVLGNVGDRGSASTVHLHIEVGKWRPEKQNSKERTGWVDSDDGLLVMDRNAGTKEGRTALNAAQARGRAKVVLYLKAHGAH